MELSYCRGSLRFDNVSDNARATISNRNPNMDCFVARHGVYYSRMLSPIGRNSLFCCSRFDVSLRDILCISKPFVWTRYRSKLTASCLSTVSLILELLFVKIGYFSISCLSQAELSCLIDFICTG